MKQLWLYYIALLILLPYTGSGQGCNPPPSSKSNNIFPNSLCSPVDVVHWDVTYVGVNDGGTTVEIHYDWDDGETETVGTTEGPDGTFTGTSSHTYASEDDRCNYRPVATLVVNGVMCTSSSQEQVVTVWDDDNTNGGRVNASPDIYPVCIGNGATMQFVDASLYNCVPPQENDVPNETTRWFQWVYGTNNTMSGAEVLVDGVARTFPFEGPMDSIVGPPAKVHGPNSQSLPITVGDDNQVDEIFEVELRYWNFCNPYPDSAYVFDRSVIKIVDLPDPTISPVDTVCQYQPNLTLTAATGGGTWSGPGIVNASTGEFSPKIAGIGNHTITYQVTDGNNCSASDTEDIVVRPAPNGAITPVDPFCIYDAPYDLEAADPVGTWTGSAGIINAATGLFDPAVAGLGWHNVAFTTGVDQFGCFGTDTAALVVLDIPSAEFLTPDSAWCQASNNQTIGEILISGTDSSRFSLVIDMRGTRDTLRNLTNDTIPIFLNNALGLNQYILVKVIESNGNTSCETDLFDTLKMEVFPQPELGVTAIYDDLCSPVDVVFQADSGYNLYTWRFGDGDVAQTLHNHTTHTYSYDYRDVIISINGTDTVYGVPGDDTLFYFNLTAETRYGCSDSYYDSIRIYPSPVADFFVTPEVQSDPDSVIFLTNLTSPGNWSYSWDFGDGTADTRKDPGQHIYDTWGIYDVALTSFSPFCEDTISKRIQILPPPPVALFEPDSIGCPPLDISFRNQSLYADNYIWDFDDGTFSTDPAPTHRFWESKEHHVKMIAIGLSGTDTTQRIISIYQRPQALFEAYPTEAKNLKQVFKFVNNSLNSSYYLWDFGDGNTSPDENPEHVYGDSGIFSVTLFAWSENDCPDTLLKENLIQVTAGEGNVIFPNAFVWNGSGPSGGRWTENTLDNTVFHPNVVNAIDFRMAIYTRWGEMIWETEELYVGWDGYLKSGELASPGVYVYRAIVKYVDGEEEVITGDVTFLH